MKIDSEVLQGPSGLIVYTDSIVKWQPPHEGDEVDEACRKRIVENIKDAFRFRGLEIQMQ
ncbi:MAG: immunity 74 family protein [Verrucomicrobiales bacterium]|nr:immunity 74 family protein [Verrucomicrobiales bacterium]